MLTDFNKKQQELPVCVAMREHLDAAMLRFGYLHPNVSVVDSDVVRLVADGDADLEAAAGDFRFELYRQKIFHETLPLREALISGIMKP